MREVIHQSQPRNCESNLGECPLGITCVAQNGLVNKSSIYGKVIALLFTQGYLCLEKDSVLSCKVMKPRGNQTINKVDGFSRKRGRETKEKSPN